MNIDAEMQRHRQSRQFNATRSIRRTLILGVCLGALGVVTGLCISWFNSKTTSDQPPANVETTRPVAPADMSGIAYLPDGTDSIIALQLRPLIDAMSVNGEKDIKPVLLQFGVSQETIAILDRAVIVGLDKVDQLVVGLKLKEGSLIRQIVVVVHTTQSFSIEAIAEKSKANAYSKDGHVYYNFRMGNLPIGDIQCWSPGDRVLVATLDSDCLKSVPLEGRQGLGHLSSRLADILSHQLGAETYCWAVLDSEKWDNIGSFLLAVGLKRGDATQIVETLASLRTVVFALQVDPRPSLMVWFDAASEAVAGEWRTWLQAKFKDDNERVAIGGAGNRVMIRTAAHEGAIRSVINRLMPKK